MANQMVERATSDMLIGPDWAANLEICDFIDTDPGKIKDVVKRIKKRLGSKTPKVQLLVLTLLETIIKNCGDISHAHVAEKEIPREMVKIVWKKPDPRVKEKILLLIDSWQEALGGPTGRYPQYYAAYHELLNLIDKEIILGSKELRLDLNRAGAVFPQKSEMSAPVLTPPRRQQVGLYNRNLRNGDAPGSSTDVKFSTLSLTEIQLARGAVDILTEMLNALGPENKEDIKQDVIVDLVKQCLHYKQRVMHLVNSTSDESLLCQGLSLNDDLQRVLSKHEAIASGTSFQKEKPKTEVVGAGRDAHFPLDTTGDNKQQPERNLTSNTTGSGTQTLNQSLLTSPATDGSALPAKFDTKLDLLSGDDYISPVANTSMALVPLTEQQPTPPLSDQNAIVLFDVHYDRNQATNVSDTQFRNHGDQGHASVSNFYQHQNFQSPPQGGLHLDGTVKTPRSSHWEQSLHTNASGPVYSTNSQVYQSGQQQPLLLTPFNGSQNNESFPPPPWEARPVNDNGSITGNEYPQSMKVTQVVFTHVQNGLYSQGPQPIGNNQVVGVYVQPIVSSQISAHNGQVSVSNRVHGGPYGAMLSQQAGQMTALYPLQMFGNQFPGYGNIQPQGPQYLEQHMYGLSIRDDNGIINSSYQVSTSNVPSNRPSKPEDNLFGDLLDMAKVKSMKATPEAAARR